MKNIVNKINTSNKDMYHYLKFFKVVKMEDVVKISNMIFESITGL